MTLDPFGQLGLEPTATADDVRAARKALARRHHPDLGGDAATMQRVNEAAGRALRMIADGIGGVEPVAEPSATRHSTTSEAPEAAEAAEGSWRVARDMPSFTVEALPVEAFEALLVVTSWMGEVLDDDPPYRLDTHLYEPVECWCRLELVPDAGAATVSLTVAGFDGGLVPSVEVVRDLWVEHLNRLDWNEGAAD